MRDPVDVVHPGAGGGDGGREGGRAQLRMGLEEGEHAIAQLGELAAEQGEFPLADLLGAGEAFLASTVREVQPVVAIDGGELPAWGQRTTEAAEAFARVVREAVG